MHWEVGYMGAFLKYLTKPTFSRLYKKTPSSHSRIIIHIGREEEEQATIH
jgi:hypothetical protein